MSVLAAFFWHLELGGFDDHAVRDEVRIRRRIVRSMKAQENQRLRGFT
jgi:hypothetical protein